MAQLEVDTTHRAVVPLIGWPLGKEYILLGCKYTACYNHLCKAQHTTGTGTGPLLCAAAACAHFTPPLEVCLLPGVCLLGQTSLHAQQI
jgi:hypothetical protein